MLDFSKHFKDEQDKKKGSANFSSFKKGDYKNMMEEKKKKIPEVLKEVQKVFENYDGSTVVLLVNHTDENGNTAGTHTLVLGVDQPEGIVKITKAMAETQDTIIDMVVKGASEEGISAILALLSGLIDTEKGK